MKTSVTLLHNVVDLRRMAENIEEHIDDLKLVREQALIAKRVCQTIASKARATQRRRCKHEHLDAGHRFVRANYDADSDAEAAVRATRHFNCVDCGKQGIKTEDVTAEYLEEMKQRERAGDLCGCGYTVEPHAARDHDKVLGKQ